MPGKEFAGAKRTKIPSALEGRWKGSRGTKKTANPRRVPGKEFAGAKRTKIPSALEGRWKGSRGTKKTANPRRVPGKEFAGAKRTKIPSALEGHWKGSRGTKNKELKYGQRDLVYDAQPPGYRIHASAAAFNGIAGGLSDAGDGANRADEGLSGRIALPLDHRGELRAGKMACNGNKGAGCKTERIHCGREHMRDRPADAHHARLQREGADYGTLGKRED